MKMRKMEIKRNSCSDAKKKLGNESKAEQGE